MYTTLATKDGINVLFKFKMYLITGKQDLRVHVFVEKIYVAINRT